MKARDTMKTKTRGTMKVRVDGETHEMATPSAETGGTLAEFLARRGFALNTRCGGRGLCNGCEVLLQAQKARPDSNGARLGTDACARSGGLQTAGRGAKRLADERDLRDERDTRDTRDAKGRDCVASGGLETAPPCASALLTKTDFVSVKACGFPLGRVAGAFDEITIPRRSLLRQQPSVVDDFRVNIPMARDPIEPGARLGAAVDIGTTTVAVLLGDLENGRTLARASAFNAQMSRGEDVLTRIEFCRAGGAAAARELQRAIAGGTIQPLLDEVCAKAGVAREDIGVVVVAGNTTMQHLLAGENPAPLGVHPFTPVFLETRVIAARDAGLKFGKSGAGGVRAHLLPGLSAYVGADIAAGLVATGMIYDEGPSVLVDAGTNGEIVAKAGGRLVGCATAAGPAFEGAGLSCGTRAVRGAVERVRLGANPFEARLGVIGGDGAARETPSGLCGSAYVDFLFEARRAGLLTGSGRFVAPEKLPAGARVEADGRGGGKLRLGPGPLWISEQDIARLLQAKAAIGAGLQTLLGALGISAREVRRVYLAGGFGMHLSLERAIGCGLLPGFEPGQIQVVGNTSLGGAFLAMNDRSLLDEMQALRARFEPLELNLQPGFEDAFIDNLALP